MSHYCKHNGLVNFPSKLNLQLLPENLGRWVTFLSIENIDLRLLPW